MLLLIALSSLALLHPVKSACESGYTATPDQSTCLSGLVAVSVNYCQCLKACAELGQRILQADTYVVLRLNLSSTVWTGINDYLVERGTNLTGWQIVPNRAGSLFINTEFWANSQPEGTSIEDCVKHKSATMKLHDVGCHAQIGCMCEHPMGNQQPVPRHYSLFVEAPVVDFTQGAIGCNVNILLKFSMELHCANECQELLDCVGFYFNSLRRECVLLQYFDGAVELKYDSVAEKMAWIKKIAKNI